MLLDFNTYVSYMCPYCGKITECTLSIFDIPKSGLPLVCAEKMCSSQIALIKPVKDKYAIEIECSACGGEHRIKLRRDKFWKKIPFSISCPETLIHIMFFGKHDDVMNGINEQAEILHEAEAEIYADPALGIYFDLIGAVNNIAKNNKVTCSVCGSHLADVSLTDDGIQIVCRGCGAQKLYKVNSATLEELLKTGTIVLE